ncbi:MAG: response regulator [Clostridia bacterium]|nr:response regulator [Clostridia bacterium]
MTRKEAPQENAQEIIEAQKMDIALRDAVIATLTNTYNTVWLITDVEKESCTLFHSDMDAVHAEAIQNALSHAKYTDTKTQYVNTMVAEEDREWMQEKISLPYILQQFETRDQYSVHFVRTLATGPRYYRIDLGKVTLPEGKIGVMMGFKDVDDVIQQDRATQKALEQAKKTEEENRRLMSEVQSAAKLADLMGSVSSLLTNMPAMSFSKDIETRKYQACNQAFAEYAGKKTPEEVIGCTDHDLFDKETADHFVEDDTRAISMDKAYVFFEDVPDATGQVIRNLQTTKIKFTDSNGRLCLLGMCVDVTEIARIKTAEAEAHAKQQELEEKLALQEELLAQEKKRLELNNMITAMASDYRTVYHVDLDTDDGVCYRADPNDKEQTPEGIHFPYYERFKWYAEHSVAESYREGFLNFIDPDRIRAGLAEKPILVYRYLAQRQGMEYYEMIRVAGVRHIEDRTDHRVHAIGLGLTVIDEEMRQSLAQREALREALEAAEDANRAKTVFLSNMSHEIRTPMNAIIGLDNIALNDPTLSSTAREHLEKIGASAHHLLGIINDILDMSRIESGRMVIKSEEFSFAKALAQVNTIISGQCRDKGLDYDCRVKGHVADYYIGDDMKLRQVMINILGNAVKFTPTGGRVSFTLEETARFDGRATLRLVMTDNGIGMSPEYLPKLFDPFSQEDSSSTSKYGSTGLGMPITKSIVELMNGHIEVESEKGKGTTFTVTVTLLESDRQSEGDETMETIHPHDLCVLVIDDDPIACEHAQLVLGQVGVNCEKALSGAEGLEMVRLRHARREPYNLILVDWRMPEMDGVETTRQIRAAVGDEIPVIILTSFSWDEIADEAKAAGVDTFVAKPLFAGSVLDEFREAFQKKNSRLIRETADLKGRRVLLAEDVPVNAEIMMMVLSMREIDAELAENGRIAVEMFERNAPGYYDAILMDMRMPEMDGLEATRHIRAMGHADSAGIPIIALTANAFDEDVQRSMQAGLNAHLSKPVEPEALFKALESLIKP